MSRSHFRKILRDVTSRKGRTLLAALSIFVGVMGVVTLFTANDKVRERMKEEIQPQFWPTQLLFTVLPGEQPVDNEAVLQTAMAIDGVEHAEARMTLPMTWKLPDAEFYEQGVLDAPVGVLNAQKLMPLTHVSGEYPTPGQKELMVELRFSERYDLDTGDTIIVQTLGSGTAVDETWTISGVVLRTYPNFLADDPPEKFLFTTFEDAQAITGVSAINTMMVRHTDFATAETNPDM